MIVKIQMRRGLKSEWEEVNPVLDSGEIGVETDTGNFKIGNNSDPWELLEYANKSSLSKLEFKESLGVIRINMDDYEVGPNQEIGPADNLLQALGKLQGQIDALK